MHTHINMTNGYKHNKRKQDGAYNEIFCNKNGQELLPVIENVLLMQNNFLCTVRLYRRKV